MYIRFVIDDLDEDSQERLGIFHAVRYLLDDGKLTLSEEEKMNDVMDWFSENLEKPNRLSKSRKKHSVNKAITWFKDTALNHINKMWEIVAVLKAYGCAVEVIKTERPGYIVYEDDFQIAGEPFKETKT